MRYANILGYKLLFDLNQEIIKVKSRDYQEIISFFRGITLGRRPIWGIHSLTLIQKAH